MESVNQKTLQFFSIALFEEIPILSALQQQNHSFDDPHDHKQLKLFGY